jgi:hypothetical protein
MSAQDERKGMEEALTRLKINAETYENCMKQTSQFYFLRYRQLVEVGFTEQQAFEIVKYRGML